MNNYNFFSGIVFLTAFFIAVNLGAQTYDHAIGLRGGAGINATYKKFFNSYTAFEGILGWFTGGEDNLGVGALYEKHEEIGQLYPLHWYWAAGAYVTLGNSSSLGAMGGIGLDISFNNLPINVSLDWLPRIKIVGDGSFFESSGGGLAVRYILD
jgi:hypothetical protein